MPRRKQNDAVRLTACLVLAMLLGSGILLKFTTLGAGLFVQDLMQTTREEAERQANHPRVVVTLSGQRIDCRRVLDHGKYWGLVLRDGRASSIKKAEVREVVDAAEPTTP